MTPPPSPRLSDGGPPRPLGTDAWRASAMKGVKIAALKKQLSKHLRAVERGAEIEVTDEWGRITRPLSSERTHRAGSDRSGARCRAVPHGARHAGRSAPRKAVLAREQIADLALATHDRELAVAARAMHLPVLGAPRRR